MNDIQTRRCPDDRDDCPSEEDLGAFACGSLDPNKAETLADMIEECTECDLYVAKCEAMSGDSILRELEGGSGNIGFEEEPECRVAMSKISDLASGGMTGLGHLRDYKLEAEIGEGGMGKVYKARHSRLRRDVAIKVLPSERLNDEGAIARFDREMEAVGQLTHPNIVQAMDAGEEDGKHYLVLEYVEGADAGKVSRALGPLPISDACEIIRQAALGLQHAHSCRLIHRDIKPSNLLISTQGEVKIVDMGLALLQQPAFGEDELTSTGQIMGTLDYIAPEQIENTHEVDSRADLYSLGCTFYRLLTGRAPFAGEQYRGTLKKLRAHETAVPEPVSGDRSDISPALQEIVHQLLAKQPEARIQSAGQVAELLQPFASGSRLRRLVSQLPEFEGKDAPTETSSNVSKRGITETRIDQQLPVIASDGDAPTVLTSSYPISIDTKAETGVAEQFQARSKSSGKATKWILLSAVCIVGLVTMMYAGQIFRIVTNKGLLIIEVDDPNLVVTVTRGKDEKPVKIHDKSTGREYTLTVGDDYLVTIEEPKADLTFYSKRFTIARGGTTVLKVTAELADAGSSLPSTIPLEHVSPPAPDPSMPQDESQKLVEGSGAAGGRINVDVDNPAAVLARVASGTNLDGVWLSGPEGEATKPLGESMVRELQKLRLTSMIIQCPMTNEQLARMPRTLKELTLGSAIKVNDETCQLISNRFPGLTQLYCNSEQLTSGGLRSLSTLPLIGLGIGPLDEGLVPVLGEFRLLRRLKVSCPTIDPIPKLTSLGHQLTSLYVDDSPVTEDGLAALYAFHSLKFLELAANDEVATTVGSLTKLRRLTLYGSDFSDAGLRELYSMDSLEHLSLADSQVTEAGIAAFRKALPDCRIESRFGTVGGKAQSALPSEPLPRKK